MKNYPEGSNERVGDIVECAAIAITVTLCVCMVMYVTCHQSILYIVKGGLW